MSQESRRKNGLPSQLHCTGFSCLLTGGGVEVLAELSIPWENTKMPSNLAAYDNKRLLANLSPSGLSSTSRLRL